MFWGTSTWHEASLSSLTTPLKRGLLTFVPPPTCSCACLQVYFYTIRAMHAEVGSTEFRATPLTSAFPGAPPSGSPLVQGEVVQVNFTFVRPPPSTYPRDLSMTSPAWRSTGLYAPPGGVVTVSLPAGLASSGKVAIQVSLG